MKTAPTNLARVMLTRVSPYKGRRGLFVWIFDTNP